MTTEKSEKEQFNKLELELENVIENELEKELDLQRELTLVLTPGEKLCLVNELILRFERCENQNYTYITNLNSIFKKLTGEDAQDYLKYLATYIHKNKGEQR